MNVKTFQGPSMAEALAKVKQELGAAAVILHTRSFRTGRRDGAGARRTVVEITAGVNVNVQARKKAAGGHAQAGCASRGRRARRAAAAVFGGQRRRRCRRPAERASASVGLWLAPRAADSRSSRIPAGPQCRPTREFAASVLKEPAFELRNEISSLRTMVESLLQRTRRQHGRSGRTCPRRWPGFTRS